MPPFADASGSGGLRPGVNVLPRISFRARFTPRRPQDAVRHETQEAFLLEILLVPQRRVENAASLVHARPGDRLAVLGNAAGQDDVEIFGVSGVLVEAALRLERLDAIQDRTFLRV